MKILSVYHVTGEVVLPDTFLDKNGYAQEDIRFEYVDEYIISESIKQVENQISATLNTLYDDWLWAGSTRKIELLPTDRVMRLIGAPELPGIEEIK